MTVSQFSCIVCQRKYAWKPELAGRKVKCRCGEVMMAPPAMDDEAPYDLANQPPPIASAPRAVSYATANVKSPDPMLDTYFPDRVKDLYMPLGLIGGGTIIFAVAAMLSRNPMITLPNMLFALGVRMIINVILMLLTCWLVSKLREISFGPLATAVFKLCAIAVGPEALTVLLGGGVIGWIAGLILYFALIGAMFDLDQADTWYVVISIFIVKLAIVLVIIKMAGG